MIEQFNGHQGRRLPIQWGWTWSALAALVLSSAACTTFSIQNPTSLVVINATTQPICEVYVTPNSAQGWGENVLTDQIPGGDRFTLPELAAGEYDLRAETCSGDAAEILDVDMNGPIEWTVSN